MARFVPLSEVQGQQAATAGSSQPTGSRFVPYTGGVSSGGGSATSDPATADPTLQFLRQGITTGRLFNNLIGSGQTGQTIGQGLGLLGGATSLAIGAQTGNPYTLTGGALSTLGSGASLLGYPGLGSAVGALSGPLGLAGGIQTLVEGKNPLGGGIQTGLGALQTYGTLSTLFPETFPSLTSALTSALGLEAGTGAAGAGAAGAGAGAAGAAGAGAGGAGAAAGSSAAGTGIAAAGGTLAGLGAAATAVLAPFAFAALMQGLEGKAPLGIGEGKPEGWSKVVSARRTAAEDVYDAIANQATGQLGRIQQQLGTADEGTLRTLGDQLMNNWLTYFSHVPYAGTQIGPSSHQVENASASPWNQSIALWKDINQALIASGKPGLAVPGGAVSVSGILPQIMPWVTEGGTGIDWTELQRPEIQAQINPTFMNYIKGVPDNRALQQSLLAQLTGAA